MQYDNYEKRIQRVARVLSVIVRKLPIIIPTLCVIVAGISALLAVKGMVGDITAPEQVTYGDSIKCEASAFMSSVHYEYSTAPDGEWTEQTPTLPGTYYVRAVGEGSFGTNKHSDEAKFTILPKSIDVTVSPSVVYGEIPTLTGSLEYGDTFVCNDFEYEDILAEQTEITPKAGSVRIVDKDGNDVSKAYNMNITSAKVKIIPRKITVTVEDSSKTYDGIALSFDKYELTGGTLANDDELIAVLDRSITDVGSIKNTPASIKVVTKDGRDATHKYMIDQQIGTLSIETRTIIIKTSDYTATYDGTTQVCLDYTVDASTPLALQHYTQISGYTQVVDSGTYKNYLRVQIYDYAGNDKTANHSIFYEEGTIIIEKLHVTVTTSSNSWTYDGDSHFGSVENVTEIGYQHDWRQYPVSSIKNVGTVENEVTVRMFEHYGGKETTNNYDIEYINGTLEVTKRAVSIKTQDYASTYNGKEQKKWSWYVTSRLGFVSGDIFTITSGTVGTDVVNTKNEIYSYTITDYRGADVSANYELGEFEYGSFIISQHYIDIKPRDVMAVYDGEAHTATEIQIVGTQSTIPSDHVFTCEMSGSITNVGTAKSRIVSGTLVVRDGTGRDITDNYFLITTNRTGTITIFPRTVYVETLSDTKMYDGTPLTRHEYTVAEPDGDTGLIEGHEISLTTAFKGSQTNVGISDNTVDLSNIVISCDGENVTQNYDIQIITGTLEVTKRPITVKSYSAEKKYDGTALTAGGGMSENTENPLVYGHSLYLDITGFQIKIGSSSNTIECGNTMITDAYGNDVTYNYYISYEQGTLTVKPWAIITITSASDSKAYDGTPLTNGEYTVKYEEGELKSGHTLTVYVTGSQTEVGISYNYMSVYVRDGLSTVNAYYTIKMERGTLEVYEPKQVEMTVAEIKTDRGGTVYLRQNSYGVYRGSTVWGSTASYTTLLPGGYNCNYLTSFALKNSGATERTAQIKLITENYMLPYYLGTSGNNTVPEYDTHYTGIIAYDYTVSYYSLTNDALVDIYSLRGNLGEYASYELDYRDYVHANYTDIPAATKAYMDAIIEEQGFDINDGSVIYKIASYIRNSATYNLDYDTSLDASGDVAVEFLKTYKEGVCRHYATSATMLYRALGLPARYVTGYMVQSDAGSWTDVTTPGHAWVEVYIDGVGWIQVEVTGSSTSWGTGGALEEIEIIPKYQSKKYDGTALEAKSELDYTASLKKWLDQGYTYEVTVRGSQTEVGRGTSSITEFVLYDSNGNDVTDDFKITYMDGVLEVLAPEIKTITVLLYQLQQQYNGEALAFGDGDWEVLDLEDGLNLDISINISLTDIGCLTLSEINGNIEKYVTYTVKDSNGNDVTENYRIVFDASNPDGSEYIPISVVSRGIELTAASESKLYDGEELTNAKVTVTMGKLVSGHTLYAIARGSITDVGEEQNVIDPTTVYIIDADGNDVTKNYNISSVIGTLKVLEPEE